MEAKKRCPNCKRNKIVNEFSVNPAKKDGRNTYCKICHSKLRKAYYKRDKKKVLAQTYARKDKLKAWLREYKEATGCIDCKGQFRYYQMDFDHLRDKTVNMVIAVSTFGSLEKLKEEIAKCELVCANCHRERTQSRIKNKRRV